MSQRPNTSFFRDEPFIDGFIDDKIGAATGPLQDRVDELQDSLWREKMERAEVEQNLKERSEEFAAVKRQLEEWKKLGGEVNQLKTQVLARDAECKFHLVPNSCTRSILFLMLTMFSGPEGRGQARRQAGGARGGARAR